MMGDGLARYHALTELLGQHRIPETAYSMIGPLFAAPLWWVGRVTGDPQGWVGYYNSILFGLTIVALYLTMRRHVEPGLLRRFLLLLVAGGMAAPHLVDFYGEMFTVSTVGVGLLVLARRDAPPAARPVAWTAIVLGVANTPAALLALMIVAGIEAVRRRRLTPLASVLAASGLIVGESWLRRGSPFATGYADNHGVETFMPYSGLAGFSYPMLLGVAAIVFSFGKGLLWFTPALFLPVRGRLGAPFRAGPGIDLGYAWLLWVSFTGGLIIVYGKWWAWYGGMYWGPRFFLIAILPAALGLAALLGDPTAGRRSSTTACATLTLSVWVAADAMAFGELWPGICYQDGYRLEALCLFTPEFSALWYPFVARPDLSGTQLGQLALHALVLGWLGVPAVARLARDARIAARRDAGWRIQRDGSGPMAANQRDGTQAYSERTAGDPSGSPAAVPTRVSAGRTPSAAACRGRP
ncbi:hypothetical protein [Plantactinospora sp. GCM10030261]|uniref:hypothetical protein n=1 Tax=Plantactinospora sp. GCM10030261 TaxID=3273420 RepID=UPI003616950D